MPVTFGDDVAESAQDSITEFLTSDGIDDDVDVSAFAKSSTPGTYVLVTKGWHPDKQGEHLTVEAYRKNAKLYTAHVYRNGQITAFS